MKQYKKILAISLAGAMILGNSAITFAADQEASAGGSGNLEYIAKKDVFDLVFPTIQEDATTFDYILDPDGLIASTKGEKYSGKTFEDGKTVYFLRSSQVDATVGGAAGKADYTDSSDEIKVVNKSTQDIELVVNAKVEAVDGITMKADTTFGATDPELYLAVKGTDGTNAAETTPITTTGVEIKKTIAVDPNAYEVKWNSTDKQYEKKLKDDTKVDTYTGFKTYTFQLTGACNQVAGWAALKDKAPKVDLVWSVKDFTVTGPQISLNAQGLVSVTGLTAEQNYESVKIMVGDKEWDMNDEVATWNTDNWSSADGGNFTIQMSDRWIDFINSNGGKAKAIINYTGGSAESTEITFTPAGN